MLASVARLSDDALVAQVKVLAAREREATADLIAALAELDCRRLYLGAGCSSLFTYCTRVLHLSEHAAYGRIEAARTARRFPTILGDLADGSLTLTAVCLLGPVLSEDNRDRLLTAARHKSKREVELLVAAERPQPTVRSSLRKLPGPKPATQVEPGPTAAPALPGEPDRRGESVSATILNESQDRSPRAVPQPDRPAVVRPLTPERYEVQFTISRETREKLQRTQDLLRHTIPAGDIAVVFERALTMLLNDLERKKLAASSRPRASRPSVGGSRHIPASVRREVWARDQGKCTFVGSDGQCGERGLLEFHHMIPYADGGAATASNLRLRCAAHNQYEATLWSGATEVDMARERTKRSRLR